MGGGAATGEREKGGDPGESDGRTGKCHRCLSVFHLKDHHWFIYSFDSFGFILEFLPPVLHIKPSSDKTKRPR